jgi:hypothetical protein
MKTKLINYFSIIIWILCFFIILAFFGYIIWKYSQINFFIGLSGPIFFLEILWKDFYWLVLIILGLVYPVTIFLGKKRVEKFTLIVIIVSLVIWVFIPYLDDHSFDQSLKDINAIRLTSNFEKTNNPAIRLQQTAQYIFDSGCSYWLEQWSNDGKYLKVSERPHGIRHCFEHDEAIINVESTELSYNYNAIEFLERPWPEKNVEIVNNYITDTESFVVVDALPAPDGKSYAVLIGKSSLMGPHDIIIINK